MLILRYKKFFHKNIGAVLILTIIAIGVSVYTIPIISFKLGNLFFGNSKALYNVNLAQSLYKRSTNPLFSLPIPQYAHYQLSRTYFIQGDLWTALNEAKKELAIYPNNTRTYYILGLTYGYMNQEILAIKMFSKFIEFKPESWAARNDKAWLQFRIGDIDGALETIEPILAMQKNNVWIQNTYCALLINKKGFKKAKIACENAKNVADAMTEESWSTAYPGNDPRIYGTGLRAMRSSIDSNLKIIEKNLSQ